MSAYQLQAFLLAGAGCLRGDWLQLQVTELLVVCSSLSSFRLNLQTRNSMRQG